MALYWAGHLPRDFFASPWGLQALHKGKVMPLLCHQGNQGRRCSNLFVVGNLVPGCAGRRRTPGTSRSCGSAAHQHREHPLQLLGGSAEPFTQGWEKGGPQICAITMLQPAHLSFLRLLRNYPLWLVGSHPAEIVTSEKVEVRPQCLQ